MTLNFINYNFQSEEDAEHYKKLVFKKYLDGELDIKTLNNILMSFEGKQNEKHDKDIAYG